MFANLLGLLSQDGATAVLIQNMDDESSAVRQTIESILNNRKLTDQNVGDLATILNSSMNPEVRSEAAYLLGQIQTQRSKASVISQTFSGTDDYAIIRVEPAPPVKVELETAEFPSKGDLVTLFSHARVEPLSYSEQCEVTSGPGDYSSEILIGHTCSSAGGSSGSPVFRWESAKVVGIHLGHNTARSLKGLILRP